MYIGEPKPYEREEYIYDETAPLIRSSNGHYSNEVILSFHKVQ